MKKIVIRAAIIVSVLLLIFQGFLMYRNHVSYIGVIHKDAQKIIKIRVDALGKSVVYNALKHPFYYFKQLEKNQDTIEDEVKIEKGFGLPANLVIYTIEGKKDPTLFSSFRIADAHSFKVYLKAQQFSNFRDLKTFQVASKNDDKISVAFHENQCVIVYNPTKENVDDIFTELLLDGKVMATNTPIFKKIKDANAHINYVSSTDELAINFSDGKIACIGNMLLPPDIDVTNMGGYPEFSNESSLKFYLNLKSSRHFEVFSFKEITVAPDSISKYLRGNIMLEFAGKTAQPDSIITYEYTDDFEKVEVIALHPKDVPEINLTLSANSKGLINYLQSASIVQGDKFTPELFPLYQFKIDTSATHLQLSSNLSKTMGSPTNSHSQVFGLQIDFVKLHEQQHFPFMETYIKEAVALKLEGKLKTKNRIAIEGEIQLRDENINAMTQFLFLGL